MKIMMMISQIMKIILMTTTITIMMTTTKITMMTKIMMTIMMMTTKITMMTTTTMITGVEEAVETEEMEISRETARVDLLPEEEEEVPADVRVLALDPVLALAHVQAAGVDHLLQETVLQEEVLHL